VAMALIENQSFPIVVYTDSWAVSQGLTVWITMWKRAAWTIHGRELWGGTELWEQLWTMGTRGETLIGHVDAHAPLISLDRIYNQQADMIAVNVIEPSLISLARWAIGKLKRGIGPGQIWQVDYIGPLPRENKQLYALTGYWLGHLSHS
uniref:RNase H type-1 domain-containing protein n=1 Tax=Erpetoichthys calabaricus TaxID=27687 RepID=A0A8C4S7I2_ERPCA